MKILNTIPAWENEPQLTARHAWRSGYVYLIASSNGLYKIGRTNNLQRRTAQLDYAHEDETLYLIYAVEVHSHYVREDNFHFDFQHKRIHGEWFALDRDDLRKLIDQFRLDEMETYAVAKWRRGNNLTDDDFILPNLDLELPDGSHIKSNWQPRRRND